MDSNSEPKIGCLHIIGLILLTVFLSVSVTLWVLQYFKLYQPDTATATEQQEQIIIPPSAPSTNKP